MRERTEHFFNFEATAPHQDAFCAPTTPIESISESGPLDSDLNGSQDEVSAEPRNEALNEENQHNRIGSEKRKKGRTSRAMKIARWTKAEHTRLIRVVKRFYPGLRLSWRAILARTCYTLLAVICAPDLTCADLEPSSERTRKVDWGVIAVHMGGRSPSQCCKQHHMPKHS